MLCPHRLGLWSANYWSDFFEVWFLLIFAPRPNRIFGVQHSQCRNKKNSSAKPNGHLGGSLDRPCFVSGYFSFILGTWVDGHKKKITWTFHPDCSRNKPYRTENGQFQCTTSMYTNAYKKNYFVTMVTKMKKSCLVARQRSIKTKLQRNATSSSPSRAPNDADITFTNGL